MGGADLYQALCQLDLGGLPDDGIGGLISLTDRRYRVAAGAARQARPGAVPAE